MIRPSSYGLVAAMHFVLAACSSNKQTSGGDATGGATAAASAGMASVVGGESGTFGSAAGNGGSLSNPGGGAVGMSAGANSQPGVGGAGAKAGAAGTDASGAGGSAANCPAMGPAIGGDGGARAVTVDVQQVVGTIRSLQGAHWDPGAANQALNKTYAAMGVDLIRTHDACGINGSGCGDIDGVGKSALFLDASADASTAASYNFGPTDALIEHIRAAGSEVLFRIGRSNLQGTANNGVPANFDKYAEIAKHVVMHYNKGWGNGFSYGIRYFEIWNEPDFLPFWSGTGDQYHELYKKIALAIKSADSEAWVGGPANSTFNDYTGLRATFFKYLKDNGLPLDFYSFHKYTNKSQDPFDFARMAQSYRDELNSFGFTATRIVNSEYESSLQGDVMLGGDAGKAAFSAEALIYMQDAPVDKATSYMNIASNPSKENHAFQMLSTLNSTPSRLCARGGDSQGFAVLAGLNATSHEVRVAIVNYQISPTLMGPISGGNDEKITASGLGELATMTYPDRRTISYPKKEGYALTIQGIPEAWGDVTITQYRIDASNDMKAVSTTVSKAADRASGSVLVPGAWLHSKANPPSDPVGVDQGVDLVVVKGSG